MTIDPSRAIGAYAAVATLAAAWLALGGAAGPGAEARFKTIDVERINVREPDGTLRMTIAGQARMPGVIVEDREYPHPNRKDAGMIFYNDEGTENGGLVFDGRLVDGKPTNGGSLTFDRWRQDQTIQMTSIEDGTERMAALIVNDRPDAPMDFGAMGTVMAMPRGPARDAAVRRANFHGARRVYLGRTVEGVSQLALADGEGRPRVRISVDAKGAGQIAFLDESGKITRTVQ